MWNEKNIFVDRRVCVHACVRGRQRQCQVQQGSDWSPVNCSVQNKTWTATVSYFCFVFYFLFFLVLLFRFLKKTKQNMKISIVWFSKDCNRKTNENVSKSHLISDISAWSATVKQSAHILKWLPKDTSVRVSRGDKRYCNLARLGGVFQRKSCS